MLYYILSLCNAVLSAWDVPSAALPHNTHLLSVWLFPICLPRLTLIDLGNSQAILLTPTSWSWCPPLYSTPSIILLHNLPYFTVIMMSPSLASPLKPMKELEMGGGAVRKIKKYPRHSAFIISLNSHSYPLSKFIFMFIHISSFWICAMGQLLQKMQPRLENKGAWSHGVDNGGVEADSERPSKASAM